MKSVEKLTIKTPERRKWGHSVVFIDNFEQILHITLDVSIVDCESVIAGWGYIQSLKLGSDVFRIGGIKLIYFPASIYSLKATIETLEKGGKYVTDIMMSRLFWSLF